MSDELRRLGSSYDVSILSYGLSRDFLDSLPVARQILSMSDSKFDDAIGNHIAITRISTAKERSKLDWEHIRDLRAQNPEFTCLFEWIALCLAKKRAYTYDDFAQIKKIERQTA